ncbi:MAG: arginase [Neisseriaceae bacterium]|jgi:arginase
MYRKISLIGAAIDACANKRGAATTPDHIKNNIQQLGLSFENIFDYHDDGHNLKKLENFFTQIANKTKMVLQENEFPIVIGGDHSCAIGTWSGITDHLKDINQNLGIIWIDAHMDAHTPESSITKNIHGMPVATLLGYGHKEFVNILNSSPKIRPENIVLLGVRSFEEAEVYLLQKLGVQVYYSHEINKEGFQNIFANVWNKLSKKVDKVGFSIDLDGFDPKFAPGVSTSEPDGINFDEFVSSLSQIDFDKIIGMEIAEGNPIFDPAGITMKCITDIIATVQGRLK